MTYSTPARLYQLRSKMTISPAAGKCCRYRCTYICVFSRSVGAGSATTRKTRGLTRSVIALIVPPFPAPSRPSRTMTTRSFFSLTHSCIAHSFTCSLYSSFRYVLSFSFFAMRSSLLPAAAERAIELGACAQFCAARVGEQQLLLEEILVGGENFDVAREPGVVARAREIGGIHQHRHRAFPLDAHQRELLNRHDRVGRFAVAVERRLLIQGERLLELRLRRLEVPPIATGVVNRLQQPHAGRPGGAGAAENRGQVAGHAAAERGQANRRIEQRLRCADVGIGGDQLLLRFHDVGTPL